LGAVEIVLTSFKMPFEKRETLRVTGFQVAASLIVILLSLGIFFVTVAASFPGNFDPGNPQAAAGIIGIIISFSGIILISIILLWVINSLTAIMFARQVNTIYSKSAVNLSDLVNKSKPKILTVLGIDIVLSLIITIIMLLLGMVMLGGLISSLGQGAAMSGVAMQSAVQATQNFSNLFTVITLLLSPLFFLTVPIAALSKKSVFGSLKQGFEVGKKNYLSLLAVMLLTTGLMIVLIIPAAILLIIVAGITALIFGLVGGLTGSLIGGVVAGAIIYILLLLYMMTVSGVMPAVAYMDYIKGKELK